MNRLCGVRDLIGIDSNAHSPLWFCERRQYVGRVPETEHRRNNMEGFILSRNLLIHYQPDQPPTICGPHPIDQRNSSIMSGKCTMGLALAIIS